jgi:hypothetical protein
MYDLTVDGAHTFYVSSGSRSPCWYTTVERTPISFNKLRNNGLPRLAQIQEHHLVPQYLGGPASGPTEVIHSAYHQLLTNAFCSEWAYGQGPPSLEELSQILIRVYNRIPLNVGG